MNARIVLNLALAMIGFGSLAQAGENAALPVLVEDHVYLLNSSAGHEGLVTPASDADAQAAKTCSARSSPKSDSSTYATPSTADTKNYDVSKPTSAKVASSAAIIPPVWIGIMCAGAGMGLVMVGAAAWKRHYASGGQNWMTDENAGRMSYRRWASSSVPTILASKLIQVQHISVKSPAVVVNPEEIRKLRHAA